MKYDNFKHAYFDDDPQAVLIGAAMEKALTELDSHGVLWLTSFLWFDLCNTAWAFHVRGQQEG